MSKVAKKSKFEDYIPIPRSAKFQQGDIVVVYVDYSSALEVNKRYFENSSPKYAHPYFNGVGTVRLGKFLAKDARFLIEFQDGNLIPIDEDFLVGPFASFKTAKKYQGKHSINALKVDKKDMAGVDQFDGEIEVDETVESTFKREFVNSEVGFEWLPRPAIIKYKHFDLCVLAYKKSTARGRIYSDGTRFLNSPDSDRLNTNPHRPEFDNGFIFCKAINKENGQLMRTSSLWSGVSGTYFIQVPTLRTFGGNEGFSGSTVVDPALLFYANMNTYAGGPKTSKRIKEAFKLFDNQKEIKTGYQWFKLRYNVKEGNFVIKEYTEFDQTRLGEHFKEIKKYRIESDCMVTFNDLETRILDLPLSVKGALHIKGKRFDSLEGLDYLESVGGMITISGQVGSLEHFPSKLNKAGERFRFSDKLDTLKGIPDQLESDIHIHKLGSFEGAQNCVNAGMFYVTNAPKSLRGFFKEEGDFRCYTITQDQIDKAKGLRDVEREFPEIEGIFGI